MDDGIFLFICITFVFIGGLVVGGNLVEKDIKRQAIERGFAEYDNESGKWKWKEVEK